MRSELELEYGIQPAWWMAQPACTSKSGWVTTHAHVNAAQRVRMQIASCRLGIAIIWLDPVAALPPAAASASEPAAPVPATNLATSSGSFPGVNTSSAAPLCSAPKLSAVYVHIAPADDPALGASSSLLSSSLGVSVIIPRRVTGKRAP